MSFRSLSSSDTWKGLAQCQTPAILHGLGCGGQESIFDGYLLVILNFHEVTYSYGSTPGPCRAGGVCCALSCGVWCSRDAVLEIWVNLFDVISPGVKSCFEVSKTCSWTLGKEKRFTSLWTWWPVGLDDHFVSSRRVDGVESLHQDFKWHGSSFGFDRHNSRGAIIGGKQCTTQWY